jgi:hypothetical protein
MLLRLRDEGWQPGNFRQQQLGDQNILKGRLAFLLSIQQKTNTTSLSPR